MGKDIIGILGDSVIPSLALLCSGLYDNLTFFYTKENHGKAAMFSNFCQFAFPKLTVNVREIPSMKEPAGVVKFATTFMESHNHDLSIFVTAGAKQTILPFVVRAPTATMVSLLHSPLRLIERRNNVHHEHVLEGIELNHILATRGWVYNDVMNKANQQLVNIVPEFDTATGKLSFTGTSWLKLKEMEHQIHSLSGKQKEDAQTFDQTTTGELLLLAEEFGKNGASYILKGALRNPNKSVLPSFIHHQMEILEEE